ncbi:hypothetical protein [Arthrobacter sp. FW306-06-A]|uniref:hypothetical protein n=1 Tax=Arthrobacter sp. FW306-06-A TaxID=2879621 RepID=UPI001F33351B|nr:hypothetical protein [Arthrobacter sp. FW306-06-A]UKA73393.1 hypothetical protein LFT49_21605 [Arthrobacter sp. FW306-06-A]
MGRRYLPIPIRLRVAVRLDMAASLTFWRVLRLSLGTTLYIIAIMYARHISQTGRWSLLPEDVTPLGPGEILGALAAVSTATIALQVMAQTAYSRKSTTLEEYSHRKMVMLLALMASTVSFILAATSWLGVGVGSFGSLENLLVVTTLAAMNCFIASDAAGRIERTESNNVDIKVLAARHSVSHFRRKRLPLLTGLPANHPAMAALLDALTIMVIIGTVEVIIIGQYRWQAWLASYIFSALWTALILTVVSRTAATWFMQDTAARWHSTLGTALLLLIAALTIFQADQPRSIQHILVLIVLPAGLSLASLGTTRNRSAWLLTRWLPGNVTRIHVARRVNASTSQAMTKLAETKLRRRRAADAGRRIPEACPAGASGGV